MTTYRVEIEHDPNTSAENPYHANIYDDKTGSYQAMMFGPTPDAAFEKAQEWIRVENTRIPSKDVRYVTAEGTEVPF